MALLEVKNLKVDYPVRGSWLAKRKFLHAVDDVSFTVDHGETVGLVGESGCGKSSIAKALVRLETPASGNIHIAGEDISLLKGRALRKARKKFQMVFQDPYGSLNPRLSIQSTLDEVLSLHTALSKTERFVRMQELMSLVGLDPGQLGRYPHEFSGGQRQRIGIARALAAEPDLLIADEPVSALDVSVQASIINLLKELQKTTRIGLLFIAHDLAVVEHISDRILVMYLGRVVESAKAEELCSRPRHPYSAALLSAVPTLEKRSAGRIKLSGDVPSPLDPPGGCAFHPRCPYATEKCRSCRPELREIAPGHYTACFHASENGIFSCEKI
ncbi:MAG: ATP-binding cassette domain-containing protein [Lentisphaeria bacterium]|nr:ATP-binding cassette domain-containing protein [Lentisphaerota bacterium]MBR7143496.1 ATP-binding cassette domain-containing protein [Lentisphaeria bacterium]